MVDGSLKKKKKKRRKKKKKIRQAERCRAIIKDREESTTQQKL